MAKGINQHRQARWDAHFERLVMAAEECAGDGISCSECPVYRNCLRWWDKSVVEIPVTAKRLPPLLSTMSRFRKKKYLKQNLGETA